MCLCMRNPLHSLLPYRDLILIEKMYSRWEKNSLNQCRGLSTTTRSIFLRQLKVNVSLLEIYVSVTTSYTNHSSINRNQSIVLGTFSPYEN